MKQELLQPLNALQPMHLGSAPSHIQTWLTTLGLPADLMELLQTTWPQQDIIGGAPLTRVTLLSAESIHDDTDWTPLLLPHQLLCIGFAYNGDWAVLDWTDASYRPGFVSHETWNFYDDADGPDSNPRQFLQPFATSLEDWVYRLTHDLFVPRDYFEAQEFNELLPAERLLLRRLAKDNE